MSREAGGRKGLQFRGSSRDDLRAFPASAMQRMGHELDKVQAGQEPSDWKPFKQIGPGATEIRIEVDSQDFRAMYVAKLGTVIYVLHCFEKKGNKTAQRDIDIAERRYRELVEELKNVGK